MNRTLLTLRKRNRRHGSRGFTLIEMLVAIVLVSIGVVAVFGGIRSMGAAQAKAQTADLLQRLAAQKLSEFESVTDPNSADSSGNFYDQGYPDVTWSMTLQQAEASNLDQITVTTTQGNISQSVNGLLFVRPTTATSSTGGSAGTTGQ